MSKRTTQKRHHTQNFDKELDKMLFMAAEQKLLPKIIYEYSSQHKNTKFLNRYRDYVKEIYTKQTARPSEYNEDEAKTHRQKFRQKILKLINNQLPIDYLKPIKVNGKYVMTYKGHPLQKIQYPTAPEYKIFNEFSEAKFKKGFEDIFEDKLEYRYQNLFDSVRKPLGKRAKTTQTEDLSFHHAVSYPVISPESLSKKKKEIQISPPLPKLVARTQFEKHRLMSPSPTKRKARKIKPINQQQSILNIMRLIGGYSTVNKADISITKQSIIKYFKQFYSRPHRIVDFLQFSNVQNFTTFSKIPQKLKLMPNEHICFMAFLFYDSNNDGYICNNDLIRIQEMAKKSKLMREDCQIMKNGASKIKFENNISYKELYRLTQVTETTFFNWLKKEKEIKTQNPENQTSTTEMKDYFEHLNRRKIFIHYEGFKKIFANQKPYLWYDILWRVSGIQYEGLSYQ